MQIYLQVKLVVSVELQGSDTWNYCKECVHLIYPPRSERIMEKLNERLLAFISDSATRRDTALKSALDVATKQRTTSRETLRKSMRTRASQVLEPDERHEEQPTFEFHVHAPSENNVDNTEAQNVASAKGSEMV